VRYHQKNQERIMGISGISGAAYSQAVDPNELFRTWADKKLRAGGDWISISEEGREKAEELAKAKREAEQGMPGMDNTDGASVAGDGTASASGLNKSPEEQMKDIESKIKALTDQLMSIMQSARPPEEKMQQAQPIQQQISQLQAQLNELKIQTSKEKAA
jgi:hypothetical protein